MWVAKENRLKGLTISGNMKENALVFGLAGYGRKGCAGPTWNCMSLGLIYYFYATITLK